MSTREKLIKARLGMLALAKELQNISWACRRAGISRSHFYEIYESLEQLEADLDRYLEFYNRARAHQGYRTQGRTPYQAFVDGIAARKAAQESIEKEVRPEAA